MDYEGYLRAFADFLMHFRKDPEEVRAMMLFGGEIRVLSALTERGGSALPGELADDAGISTARTAVILAGIQKKGFVNRGVDPTDRRKFPVRITPEGERYLAAKHREIHEFGKSVIDELGQRDTEELIRLLGKLTCIIGEQANTPCE